MNIVVCIKQVPDVDDIKWTKENNLDRAQMLSKINPYDEWAIDWAVSFKDKFKDVNITALSMGPNQAVDVLNYALAKGANRAILLSDKAFSGSDTLATSKILSRAIEKYLNDFNIILTGQMAQDGDTAQVPVSLAQLLNIVDAINVDEIFNIDKNSAIVSQKIENEINILELSTPCLIAVNKECVKKYQPKIEDYIKAQNTKIESYGLEDLGFDKNEVGILGSPTMVYRAYRPQNNKNPYEIKQDYTQKIIDLLLEAR